MTDEQKLPEPLTLRIEAAMNILAQSFVFRKLGICYDLRATPDNFPSPLLPIGKEIVQGLPAPSGARSGMAEAAINNALLLDGYALRLEIGFAKEEEDRIFDRLIGGAIRLATIAPKSALIGSLSPDGKSFYPVPGADNYLAWAFYAWRSVTTATVAPESQGKLKNIAARWMARLESDNFVLPGDDKSLSEETWDKQPLLPAMLAAAWALTGEEKWKKLALEKAVFSASVPTEAPARPLMITQMALHLLAEIFPGEEVGAIAQKLQAQLLPLAYRHLEDYRRFEPTNGAPVPDWRTIPANGELPAPWLSMENELQTLASSAQAALACLFCKDKERLEAYTEGLTEFMQNAPLEQARLAASLCPMVAAHARGVELGLWDVTLSEYQFNFDTSKTLVERFMQPEYDELNPEQAGHEDLPEKPPVLDAESGEKNGRRRRRRRKRK